MTAAAPSIVRQRGLEEYVNYFTRLSPRSVRLIEKIATPDMRFTDPFNDVAGIERVERILEKMFRDVESPKFTVLDTAWSRSADTAYLKWRFECSRNKRLWSFEGMSEVTFTPEGKVCAHVDFWDSGAHFYARLPLLGGAIRWVRGKVTA